MNKDLERILNKINQLKQNQINKDKDSINEMWTMRDSDIIQEVKTIIETVAKEQNNDWIYCRDRLPNDYERWIGKDITEIEPREFIVMVKGATIPTTGYYHDLYGWIKDIDGSYDNYNTGYANDIIAWRFFPEFNES